MSTLVFLLTVVAVPEMKYGGDFRKHPVYPCIDERTQGQVRDRNFVLLMCFRVAMDFHSMPADKTGANNVFVILVVLFVVAAKVTSLASLADKKLVRTFVFPAKA
jgi:hypothetical protein